jgi:hypothetical protein
LGCAITEWVLISGQVNWFWTLDAVEDDHVRLLDPEVEAAQVASRMACA